MAFTPPIGSVVAFQSDPTKLVGTVSVVGTLPVVLNNSSIISVQQGSVATVIVGGSIAASFTPPANQSVSGAVSISNFPTTQNVSGSVVATQGTNPWTVTSSIAGGIFPVSGSVSAVVTNNVTVVSSIAGGIFPISGSVAATIVGTPNVNTAGSVVAFQGTSPWVVNYQNSSIITVSSGSIAAVIIGGSILTSSTANQSVSGTVQTDVRGSVATVIIGGSIAASFTPPANQSVSGTVNIAGNPSISGTVLSQQTGTWNTSITSTIPSSVLVGASIFGQLPAGTAMIGSIAAYQGSIPWTINSVYGNISGSVAATITNTNVNVSGSVAAFQAGTWKPSIASNYASNSASIISALGMLTLGVRNDTLASVLAVADGSYGPFAVGQYGDQIVSMAPSGKWVSGIASTFTGVEQPLITSVLGTRINVTGIQIANASANNVYLSFYGAGIGSVTGSIIGFSVAPANGGSNINFPVPLQTAINAGFSASVSGVASVFLSAQGFLSKV